MTRRIKLLKKKIYFATSSMKVIRIIRETQTFITIIFPYLHIIIITKYPYIGQSKYKIKKKNYISRIIFVIISLITKM